jgi:hypothetical protein
VRDLGGLLTAAERSNAPRPRYISEHEKRSDSRSAALAARSARSRPGLQQDKQQQWQPTQEALVVHAYSALSPSLALVWRAWPPSLEQRAHMASRSRSRKFRKNIA